MTTIIHNSAPSSLRATTRVKIKDRNQIILCGGKANKDRSVLLRARLKDLLVFYFDHYQPKLGLFEGQQEEHPYASASIHQIVQRAARKASINRRVTPQTLKDCFATHWVDKGTNVRYIQELLGHKDIKTTLIYTHVTTNSLDQIRCPMDQMELSKKKWKK